MTHRQLEDVRLLQFADILALGLQTIALSDLSISFIFHLWNMHFNKFRNFDEKKQLFAIDTEKQYQDKKIKDIININRDNFSKVTKIRCWGCKIKYKKFDNSIN